MQENQPHGTDTWTRRPDAAAARGQWSLRRCPTKGTLSAVIISHDVLGRYTHYYGGRTRPCTGRDCEPCNKSMRPRWHGYLACIDLDTNEKIIVEITAIVAARVAEWFDERRTLKGSRIRLQRRSPKTNGRVTVSLAPPAAGTGELPQAPDVRPIMNRVWELHDEPPVPTLTPQAIPLQATGTDRFIAHGNPPDTLD